MGIFRQIGEYLFLVKKDTERPTTQWTKYMHGINRLTILLFLAGIIILVLKWMSK